MKYLSLIAFVLCLVLVSCSKQETETFDHFFFHNEGADLFVEVNGNIASNTFILLLHGGPGGGAEDYNNGYYTDELEKDYAIVYLDQRGNGASTGNYDKSTLTIAQNSKDVYQLIRFMKIKYGQEISVFLAGHSWGGLTTAHALIHTETQDEIKGWIEINGGHDFPMNDIEAVKLFQELGNIEIASGNNLDFWEPVLETVNQIDTLDITGEEQGFLNSKGFEAEEYLPIAEPDLPDSGPAYGLDGPSLSLATYTANLNVNPILNNDSEDIELTDRLGEITIPSLFLWGKYDLVVPPALGVSAYNRVNTEEKELVIFEHSGHSPMNSEPLLFVEEVRDFVEQYK